MGILLIKQTGIVLNGRNINCIRLSSNFKGAHQFHVGLLISLKILISISLIYSPFIQL
jgi:hypothetical protein